MDIADGAERLGTIRVGEIMIPVERYPKVSVLCTLRDAVAMLEKTDLEVNGRRSLPRVLLVFEIDGSLAGIVRRRDIMRGLEPKFLGGDPMEYSKKLFDVKIDPNLTELSHERLVRVVREQANRPVGEVMRPTVTTIDYDDHIMKAIYEVVSNNVSLLPVMQNRKVVGVVRSVELFHEVARLIP